MKLSDDVVAGIDQSGDLARRRCIRFESVSTICRLALLKPSSAGVYSTSTVRYVPSNTRKSPPAKTLTRAARLLLRLDVDQLRELLERQVALIAQADGVAARFASPFGRRDLDVQLGDALQQAIDVGRRRSDLLVQVVANFHGSLRQAIECRRPSVCPCSTARFRSDVLSG